MNLPVNKKTMYTDNISSYYYIELWREFGYLGSSKVLCSQTHSKVMIYNASTD